MSIAEVKGQLENAIGTFDDLLVQTGMIEDKYRELISYLAATFGNEAELGAYAGAILAGVDAATHHVNVARIDLHTMKTAVQDVIRMI